jgi:hypothetical protein
VDGASEGRAAQQREREREREIQLCGKTNIGKEKIE